MTSNDFFFNMDFFESSKTMTINTEIAHNNNKTEKECYYTFSPISKCFEENQELNSRAPREFDIAINCHLYHDDPYIWENWLENLDKSPSYGEGSTFDIMFCAKDAHNVKEKLIDKIQNIKDFINYFPSEVNHPKIDKVSDYLINAVNYYYDEEDLDIESSLKKIENTYLSAKNLIKILPSFIGKKNLNFYIDSNTGFFGFIYKPRENSGTLNAIIEAKEIKFSLARKRESVASITGTTKLGRKVKNAHQISLLFKLMI